MKQKISAIIIGCLLFGGLSSRAVPTLDYTGSVVPVTSDPQTPNLPGWTATPIVNNSFDTSGLSSDGNDLIFTSWAYPKSIFTPTGLFGDFAQGGSNLEMSLSVTSGSLYFVLEDGSRQYQVVVKSGSLQFLKLSPAEVVTVAHDFLTMTKVKLILMEGKVGIYVNDRLLAYESAGQGGARSTNYLQVIALSSAEPPTAKVDYIKVEANPPPTQQGTLPSIPGYSTTVGSLDVAVGPTKQIARGSRTPLVRQSLTGIMTVEGSPAESIQLRSTDNGQTWTETAYPEMLFPSCQLATGKLLTYQYNPQPISGQPGYYLMIRSESTDFGQTYGGPYADGRLYLPTSDFSVSAQHWIISDIIHRSNGDVVAVVSSQEYPGTTDTPWKLSLIKSTDSGVNWTYVSRIMDRHNISDPNGLLVREGWPLYYAVEPAMVDLGNDKLIVIARAVNDEEGGQSINKIGSEMSTYSDLFSTVSGDGIHSSLLVLPSDKYYQPGRRNGPMVIAYSNDGGVTWINQKVLDGPRGTFPRLAVSSGGTIALTFGGLSGIPRWGNAVVFSRDDGLTWSPEINFGPYLTTGSTSIKAIGVNKFLAFFDCTPPQPWTNQAAWWIGTVELTVTP
jgi:hypothetical protein